MASSQLHTNIILCREVWLNKLFCFWCEFYSDWVVNENTDILRLNFSDAMCFIQAEYE